MSKKILIIDDSALMRRVLSDIIKSDIRFTVSNVATNGLEGFDLITRDGADYDAVILDINMPKMNGIEFLRMLEKHHIQSKVIVVSILAKEGARETIEALELGAFDFVTKPESFYEVKSDRFRQKILQCLCAATNLDSKYNLDETTMLKTDLVSNKESNVTLKQNELPKNIQMPKHVRKAEPANKIVALACSTGGPKALQSVIPMLPSNMDSAMLIVQHMPAGFTKSLAQRLNELSKITVKEAEDGEILKKGCVYIAIGGKHLRVVKGGDGKNRIQISDEPARMGLKPCADIMYESLVESDYDEITCVVLTGMGADGTSGIKLLEEKKDVYVIAQDEETSTVYGMPKMVAVAGLVDEIQPLTQIALAITKNIGVN